MENETRNAVTKDILKLQKASKLIEEVFENLNGIEKAENLVLPLTLHGANTRIRNVANVLKIALDPEAKVSVSIPMYTTNKDKEDAYYDVMGRQKK